VELKAPVKDPRSIARHHRVTVLALAALAAVALLCAWQVLSGLFGGEVFTGAAGRSLWIRWPNVPDLFIRAMIFYGAGFLLSSVCAFVIGLGLLDSVRHERSKSGG